MTASPSQRQTCSYCLRTIGILPNGFARPFTTEALVGPGLRRLRFHRCADAGSCQAAREQLEHEGRPQ